MHKLKRFSALVEILLEDSLSSLTLIRILAIVDGRQRCSKWEQMFGKVRGPAFGQTLENLRKVVENLRKIATNVIMYREYFI